MARPAVSTEGFIGHFRNVRSAHHDRHTYGTNSIRHAVRLCDHPGHRADPDKSNVVFANEPRDICFIHPSSVAVDQQHFMAWRS
jgi:hypothetical protein